MTEIQDSALLEYQRQLALIQAHRAGSVLRDAAETAVVNLRGKGSVLVVALSDEGLALAAAISVLRDEPTSWQRLDLQRHHELPANATAYLVEPITVDAGIRQTVAERYPAVGILELADQRLAATAA